ncbi:FAD-binding oxidoreductase [Flexibacterium corallicola]|uniref:FAD-binding oxidoreductase n=1 Tax=Flexibacterium corallicola TaxID=3037259 RepID=UPI00286F8DA0|nr:FAD-binding oxidoreductase [Pseudovibrio sp. M1P-2-3]
MPENIFLSAINGYDETITEISNREKNGTDFSEAKGEVTKCINKLHPKRLNLTVSKVISETPTCKTLRLKPEAGLLPPYQAGQYINIFVDIDGVSTARPFAISSAPSQREYYDITIRYIAEGFVSRFLLEEVQVGQTFETTGPMGSFYHNPLFHGKDLVFLAGGSGVAPAMSMIQSIIDQGLPYNFHLIYGSRTVDDIIFQDQLKTLESKHDFLKISEVISEPDTAYAGTTGFITAELIGELLGELTGKMFYICGPTAMNEFCKEELCKLGVQDKRIRMEVNGPPKNPENLEFWPEGVSPQDMVTVTVQGKGSYQALIGEPLLNSLERNGYGAENACRSGECSLCRCKLVSGKVFNPSEAKLRASDRTFGWLHSCVAFPVEDIEILL